ncbi:acyl-CoA dehydrogenase family protein, partial [Frankia sp. EI5c]|uniref:acyl-CoA dehydrogenase family protein n=1 Tax=Frankia sp. EI5c TaxID=683316 RepID=UPI001A7EE867
MRFALSEEQTFLQRITDDVSTQLFTDSAIRDCGADGTLRADAWKKLVELDLVGLLVPEEHGGAGGSVTDACVVAEVLGRHIAPVPYVGTAIAAAALLRFADGPGEILAGLGAGAPCSVLLDTRLGEPAGEASIAFDWTRGAVGVALGPDGTAAVHTLTDDAPVDDIDPLHPLRRVRPVPATTASDATEGARRARAIAWI